MENNSSAASQFRPHHHSLWLDNTLSEVDAKFKTILKLVKDNDGETFAKRAEMYYHNKPQLIELVQDLHKSYRVLVENHDQLKCDSTRAYNSNCNNSLRIVQNPSTPVVESADVDDLNNFKTKSLMNNDNNPEAVDCGTLKDDNLNNFTTISMSLIEDSNTKAADCGTPTNDNLNNEIKTISVSLIENNKSEVTYRDTPTDNLNNLKTISTSLIEERSSEAANCGIHTDDELAVEVNDVEAGYWDFMKSNVTLLRDNESVLVTCLRKYEDQRAEIRTLKSEVMLLRHLLDLERLENKEKQSSRSIPKFKRALSRLLSTRKN